MAVYQFLDFIPVVHPTAFVHPQANVTGDVIIGPNCYIGPGAVLRGDWGRIVLEEGVNVQENCVVHMFPKTETRSGGPRVVQSCTKRLFPGCVNMG